MEQTTQQTLKDTIIEKLVSMNIKHEVHEHTVLRLCEGKGLEALNFKYRTNDK